MNEWIYYGLIAALFISIKDIAFNDISKKYNYIDLIIITNILIFILTIGYLIISKRKVQKVDKLDICKLPPGSCSPSKLNVDLADCKSLIVLPL